ncbi:MAG: hypothetical protein K8R92_06700 [Planctomycetes bacterium]|nr:hypothetical protein [Planctomycetota bacterium]
MNAGARADPPTAPAKDNPKTAGASNNAAASWNELFPNLRSGDKNPLHMTDDDWDAISMLSSSQQPTLKEIERGRQAMEKLQPVMDQLVSTSKLRKCDFEHDYSQGFEMLLPEMSPMRQAARVLRARSYLALTDGDWDTFADSMGAVSNLSRQVSQSPVLISSLVASAIGGGLTTGQAQFLIDEGSLTPEKAERLLNELAPLRGSDPFGFSKSVDEEYKVLLSSNYDGKRMIEALGEDPNNDRFKNLDAAAIHQAILPLAGIYQEAAAAMKEPDKESARKRWEAAWNARDKLPRNSQVLLELVMPSIESIIKSRFEAQDRIDALMAALQGIASGKSNPASLATPAIWWSRAAAAARSLNEEQQAAMVMQQLSSVPDNSPLQPVVMSTLDACDATVFECMRRAMACESKVVSFEKVAKERTPLDLALIGGLRGAARMAMAQSLLPRWNAEKSLSFIAMAIAACNALASDPTFAHALASQSIAEELADAIWRFSIRTGVSDELRNKLDALIATIPRSDAFGFVAAQKKVRARLTEDLRYDFERNDDVKDDLTKAIARKSPTWLFAVEILYGSNCPAAGPEGTLVSTDDLFPPDNLKELAAACEKLREEKVKERESDTPVRARATNAPAAQRVRKYLNDINPPAMRDISLDMNRVGDALSALDAAAAKRRETK